MPPSLVIATSVRGAEVWAAPVAFGYAESLRHLSHELDLEIVPPVIGAGADNIRTRNRVAALVLREHPKATHVLWWDDDQWPADRNVVREMMSSGEDVISAPYTRKKPPIRWSHVPLNPEPTAVHGRQEVRFVGFGFTMTTRRCLEAMSAAARPYSDGCVPTRDIFGMLFDSPVDGAECPHEQQELLSEDYSFCKRWRLLGGRVVLKLDAGIIYHAGSHAWTARDIPGGVVG